MPEKQEKRVYQFDDFLLEADEHVLRRGTERIPLSPRTFALLVKLVENAGHLLPKETLINEVWADSIVEEGNLNRTISNLRKALSEKPHENRFIETVPRIGYRFTAPVEILSRDASAKSRESKPAGRPLVQEGEEEQRENLESGSGKPQTTNGGESENKKSKRLAALLALGLVAAAAFGYFGWRYWQNTSASSRNQTNTNEPIRLTRDPNDDSHPHWTNDGRIRFFRTDPNRQSSSLIMNADGSNQHRIYYSGGISSFPAWSPDGREIAFTNDKEDNRTGNFEIFSIEPETSEAEKRLTFRRRFDISPAFSPDGRRLAFVSQADGNSEIYLMNRDGSHLLRVTRHPAEDISPQFSKDGKRIIFSSNRDGKYTIYEIEIR